MDTSRFSEESLREELRAAEDALARLAAELRAGGRDVETLKGSSAETLLYTLLASRDERLRREREAFLQARSRYGSLTRRVASLRRELTEAGAASPSPVPVRTAA